MTFCIAHCEQWWLMCSVDFRDENPGTRKATYLLSIAIAFIPLPLLRTSSLACRSTPLQDSHPKVVMGARLTERDPVAMMGLKIRRSSNLKNNQPGFRSVKFREQIYMWFLSARQPLCFSLQVI